MAQYTPVAKARPLPKWLSASKVHDQTVVPLNYNQFTIPGTQHNNDLLDISKLIVYYHHMIKSFRCRETEKIFHREHSRKFSLNIQQWAFMKLNAVDAAIKIEDLRLPPSNHLEALKGKRQGQWSIRINDQWRICFVWHNGNAEKVEIVDYH